MAHQTEALKRLEGKRWFGLFCEQGTGKTWMALADAERAYAAGKINALLIVAPKGVHTNWTRREIPEHVEAPTKVAAYLAGSKSAQKSIEALHREGGDKLRVLSINIDALNTDTGFKTSVKFLERHRAIMVVDESHRIKTPNTGVTRRTLALGRRAVARRIATGTPLTNMPSDLYSQFEFLRPGLLGFDSYRAFVAQFAEILPDDHHMMRHIMKSSKFKPQLIARDRDGEPRWRNLDQLRELLEPHVYRVLKRDCLDLPEKIYQTRFFELSARQQEVYRRLERRLIIEHGDDLLAVHALAARTKLQQITSGFVNVEGEPFYVAKDNPRLALLREIVQDQQGQFIIWARFTEELTSIKLLMDQLDIPSVEYRGEISARDREAAVDDFQSGKATAFIGQPQSGGLGLTLTAAKTVIYYSNDFNYGTRTQSEDRAHRKGTMSHVVYIDLVATDTIDEAIARNLQRKGRVAAQVLGD